MILTNNLLERIEFDAEEIVNYDSKHFFQFGTILPVNYAGWKFTIIGKSTDDAMFLLETVGKYLANIGVTFKIGTKKLIETTTEEQSRKLLTIYIHKGLDTDLLLSDLIHLLAGYNGHDGITLQYSEHVSGAIYKRYDIDKYGQYIPAGN